MTKHGIIALTKQEILDIENWLGGQIDVVTTTYNQRQFSKGVDAITWDGTKAEMEEMFGSNTSRQLIVAYEMGGPNRDEYQRCANGDFDSTHQQLAQDLISMGMEDTIFRLSHEFNLSWGSKSAYDDPQAYRDAYAHTVSVMQSQTGANFEFLFSPARNQIGVADEAWPHPSDPDGTPSPQWPSGELEPTVTPSLYDSQNNMYPDNITDYSESEKQQYRDDVWNNWIVDKLNMWEDFAAQRNTNMGTAEWGVANDGYPNNSGGDNASYIRRMIEWMDTNSWELQAYWNADSASGGSHVIFPRSAANLEDASDKFQSMVGQRLSNQINSAPTADAGPDTSVAPNTAVTLDGTGSSDPDGDTLSYSWTQTGGTSVTLSDSNTATPDFTSPNSSTKTDLTFELTVDDGALTDTDSVTVTVTPASSDSLQASIQASSTLTGTLTVTQRTGTIAIEDNWFYDTDEPDPTGSEGDAIWIERGDDAWSDVNATVTGNHYHPLEPDLTIGCVRTGREPDWFDDILPSTVVENYEDGSASDLGGDSGDYEYQTGTVLDGGQSLRSTAAGAVWVATAEAQTVRDRWYSTLLQYDSSVTDPGVLFNVDAGESTGAADLVGYRAYVDTDAGELAVDRVDSGDGIGLVSESVDVTQYEGVTLRCAWTVRSTGLIRVRFSAADGSGGWEFITELQAGDAQYVRGQLGASAESAGAITDAATVYTVSAPDAPIPETRRRIPPRGWYVEIDHPDAGSTLTPTVVDGESVSPTPRPTLNGLPECEIPVPADETWLDDAFERATIRVWQDGERVPVERIVDRQLSDSGGVVTITARGGEQLLSTLDPAEFVDGEQADAFVRSLLEDHTDYKTDVDDPRSVLTSDIPLVTAGGGSDTTWEDVLPAAPFADDQPVSISDSGWLQTHEIAEMEQGVFSDREVNSPDVLYHDAFVNGSAAEFRALGEVREYDLTTEYEMQNPTLYVHFSKSAPSSGPGVTVSVDGTAVSPGGGVTEIDHTVLGDTPYLFDNADYLVFDLSSLSAGEHTVKIETTTGSSSESLYVDCLGFIDEAFHQPDGSTLTEPGGQIAGQAAYPDWTVETRDYGAIQQIRAGELDSTWFNTDRNQSVAISNDDGANWIEAANSDSVTGQFDSGSNAMRARFALSAFDSGGGVSEWNRGQSVGQMRMSATLDSSPVLTEQKFDGTIEEALNEIADYGNFIWEVRWDRTTGELAVEMSQPGQRRAAGDPSVLDFTVTIDERAINKKAIVKGAAKDVDEEELVADAGSAVSLAHQDLVTGETSVKAQSDGTEYERGSDFAVDPVAGTITAQSDGAITDGETLLVSYSFKIRGEYELPGWSGDPEQVYKREIPQITTEQAAQSAAMTIVKETNTPLQRAEVQIDQRPAGWHLIEVVSFVDLPDAVEAMEIYSLEESDGTITLQLGNRDKVSQVVSRIQQRLAGVSSRV